MRDSLSCELAVTGRETVVLERSSGRRKFVGGEGTCPPVSAAGKQLGEGRLDMAGP